MGIHELAHALTCTRPHLHCMHAFVRFTRRAEPRTRAQNVLARPHRPSVSPSAISSNSLQTQPRTPPNPTPPQGTGTRLATQPFIRTKSDPLHTRSPTPGSCGPHSQSIVHRVHQTSPSWPLSGARDPPDRRATGPNAPLGRALNWAEGIWAAAPAHSSFEPKTAHQAELSLSDTWGPGTDMWGPSTRPPVDRSTVTVDSDNADVSRAHCGRQPSWPHY